MGEKLCMPIWAIVLLVLVLVGGAAVAIYLIANRPESQKSLETRLHQALKERHNIMGKNKVRTVSPNTEKAQLVEKLQSVNTKIGKLLAKLRKHMQKQKTSISANAGGSPDAAAWIRLLTGDTIVTGSFGRVNISTMKPIEVPDFIISIANVEEGRKVLNKVKRYEIENLTIAANTCTSANARVAAIHLILSLLEAKDQNKLTQVKFDEFKGAAVELKILLATSVQRNPILPLELCQMIPYLRFDQAQEVLEKIIRKDITESDIATKYPNYHQLVEDLLDVYDNGLTKAK